MNLLSFYEREEEKGPREWVNNDGGVAIKPSVNVPFLHKGF